MIYNDFNLSQPGDAATLLKSSLIRAEWSDVQPLHAPHSTTPISVFDETPKCSSESRRTLTL